MCSALIRWVPACGRHKTPVMNCRRHPGNPGGQRALAVVTSGPCRPGRMWRGDPAAGFLWCPRVSTGFLGPQTNGHRQLSPGQTCSHLGLPAYLTSRSSGLDKHNPLGNIDMTVLAAAREEGRQERVEMGQEYSSGIGNTKVDNAHNASLGFHKVAELSAHVWQWF